MEKWREEREFDAEDRFAATIADDLWQLPVRVKILAKNYIRNTLFKYHMEVFNQHNLAGNVSLKLAQCSGYTEILNFISLGMTYINQHQTAGEKIIKVFKQTV